MSRAGVDADIAQSVERILGKDEVSGSNPDISSIKEKARVNPLLFLLYSCLSDAEPENAKAFYYFVHPHRATCRAQPPFGGAARQMVLL